MKKEPQTTPFSVKKSLSVQNDNEEFRKQIRKLLTECHVFLHEYPKWSFYNKDNSFATASFNYDSVKQRIAYKMILDELFGETKLEIDISRNENHINFQTQIDFSKPRMVMKTNPDTLEFYFEWED